MESLGPIIASVAIAATTAFGGFHIDIEAHPGRTVPPPPSVGHVWPIQMVKFKGGKAPAIFTHPDLAVGLLTLSVIGARLALKGK